MDFDSPEDWILVYSSHYSSQAQKPKTHVVMGFFCSPIPPCVREPKAGTITGTINIAGGERGMDYSVEDHCRAIENTKQAIDRAQVSGNTHEADFLTRITLPRLEKRLAETRMPQT